jgi:hypothetical protein
MVQLHRCLAENVLNFEKGKSAMTLTSDTQFGTYSMLDPPSANTLTVINQAINFS